MVLMIKVPDWTGAIIVTLNFFRCLYLAVEIKIIFLCQKGSLAQKWCLLRWAKV
jgi:hypothetical protein